MTSILLMLLLGCPSEAVDPVLDCDGEDEHDEACPDDDDDVSDDDDGADDDDTADDDDSGPLSLPDDRAFDDVTAEVGMPELPPMGCGVAVADVNADGWPDFYVTIFGQDDHLYLNQGDGTFEQAPQSWGLMNTEYPTFSASFADIDNDGDPDLVLGKLGVNAIFRHDGDHFTNVSNGSALAGPPEHSTVNVSWADFDQDGDLDAYLTTGEPDPKIGDAIDQPDQLLRNDGDFEFTNLSDLIPFDNRIGAGFVTGWTDTDHDGDPDLYTVNDFGDIVSNQLYINEGPSSTAEWSFSVATETCSCNLADAGMGLAIGDFDRDGWQDFYTSNGALENGGMVIGEKLLLNDGGNSFIDVTQATDATAARFSPENGWERQSSWGVDFIDVDNDGWLDVFVPFGAGGKPEPDALMVNMEGERFVQHANSGADSTNWSMGISVVDINLDGCLDMIVASRDFGGTRIYQNRCRWQTHWLQVELRGTTSNRDAVGAVAIARMGELNLREEVLSTSTSAHGSRWLTLQFGLGSADVVPELEITWPSGLVETLHDVAADQHIVVVEGEAR
jgi:enediyne biosynthesis protein E4